MLAWLKCNKKINYYQCDYKSSELLSEVPLSLLVVGGGWTWEYSTPTSASSSMPDILGAGDTVFPRLGRDVLLTFPFTEIGPDSLSGSDFRNWFSYLGVTWAPVLLWVLSISISNSAICKEGILGDDGRDGCLTQDCSSLGSSLIAAS